MLSGISWQSYWTTLSILILFYYVAVYVLYFRRPGFWPVSKEEGMVATNLPSFLPNEELFDKAFNELAAFFEEAKRRSWQRSELSYCLQQIFGKYRTMEAVNRETLSKLARSQAEAICSIHLKEEEMDELWWGG